MEENTSQGLKRSNDEIGIQDSVTNMESNTTDSIASKRSKVDSVKIEQAIEDDMDTTGQVLAKELKDPATGLTASQASALERAKLFAKELQEEATEDDVRRKLGRFGPIKELALKVDPMSGKHRGFCFVEYELPEAAIVAVQASDTVEVVGRHLKIGRPKNYDANAVNGTNVDIVVDSMKGFTLLDTPMGVCKAIIGGPIPDGMKALDNPSALLNTVTQGIVAPSAATVSPAMIARATATAASTAQRLVAMQNGGAHDRESVASEENMSISGNQRYMVMQSLARSAGESGLFPSSGAIAQAHGSIESTVVRLQYNATPADIDDQLEEEFSEECSKYGPVVRVHMMPLTDGVLRIFIQFGSPVDAKSASLQLNGRQFDGKTIGASLFDQQEFLGGNLK
ncbi:Poly(U)-binding-splicing factor puf60 [Podila epicladia]|nr:Poly(U)-binding-splicing factor puf60 [Podila epicladia]